MALIPWFKVSFSDDEITLDVKPPGKKPWIALIKWKSIIRICFQAGDYLLSDELYIFTKNREESHLIPIDGDGGLNLWNEILSRGLFDPKVAIELASATNELRCHSSV